MSQEQTVTGLLLGICGGNGDAIQKLVDIYLEPLVNFGRRKYRRKFADIPRPAEDEEDAALSALDSFCAAAREGRINGFSNRHQTVYRELKDIRERWEAYFADIG
jgi:hypothetical protein